MPGAESKWRTVLDWRRFNNRCMPLLGRRLPSIDQHQHASSDARVAAPPDAFGHLSATLHRFDGLVSVAAPVGEVFGVVPG